MILLVVSELDIVFAATTTDLLGTETRLDGRKHLIPTVSVFSVKKKQKESVKGFRPCASDGGFGMVWYKFWNLSFERHALRR